MTAPLKLAITDKQKRLILESFETVRSYETAVLVLFYGRLFEIAPEARALFKIDIREQSGKLMGTLDTVMHALDRFDQLRPQLAELGRKHVTYGVQPYLYEKLRTALLWALGQALGPEFTRETRTAWETVLTAISAVMIESGGPAPVR